MYDLSMIYEKNKELYTVPMCKIIYSQTIIIIWCLMFNLIWNRETGTKIVH